MERKFLDFSLPGSECSTERTTERKFHGSESSLYGLFAPGNESAEERKGQLPSNRSLQKVQGHGAGVDVDVSPPTGGPVRHPPIW